MTQILHTIRSGRSPAIGPLNDNEESCCVPALYSNGTQSLIQSHILSQISCDHVDLQSFPVDLDWHDVHPGLSNATIAIHAWQSKSSQMVRLKAMVRGVLQDSMNIYTSIYS